jgi:hydrogenase maturation protease
MTPKILVAGVGNIFLGDDGFGVEVLQQLVREQLPENVEAIDFGIRGFDLAYALMEPYDAVILVDALPRGDVPGTLCTIEPDLSTLDAATPEDMNVETHGMNPMKVLALVKAMGGQPKRLYVVGCEPEHSSEEDDLERMGLSAPVALAVDEAVAMINSLIKTLSAEQQTAPAL